MRRRRKIEKASSVIGGEGLPECDLKALEALASNPKALLDRMAKDVDGILEVLRPYSSKSLTAEQVFERFRSLEHLHAYEPRPETFALLKMLAMGKETFSDGKIVSLDEAIAYSKACGDRAPFSQRPKCSELREARPGPLSDEEFARVLGGEHPDKYD